MKIAYQHLLRYIASKPPIHDMSEKLFQLGHEHEIHNDIFDMEFTPNRGDCLSLKGILRDLAIFYEIDFNEPTYIKDINPLKINFSNNAVEACPNISFLKIEIKDEISPYKTYLEDYFIDLDIKKNNFFTDISNYLSYETGQPTHCYDEKKISNKLSLEIIDGSNEFKTLFDKKILLEGKNLVFTNKNKIINLAGIIGGKNSACSKDTKSVIIECAYFNPEVIIGKSVKYDVHSEASHKFERGVDPKCQEEVLRRFLQIVGEHVDIIDAELFSGNYLYQNEVTIPMEVEYINKILGTEISEDKFLNYLLRLGFRIKEKIIYVPSHRSDIKTNNDIAEEIARAIGYNNIKERKFKIQSNEAYTQNKLLSNFKSFLVDNGFYEVINYPFSDIEFNNSVVIDNPLDSNKKFLRTNLKNSLLNNLLYNERRQNDSIKLFEISDVYSSIDLSKKDLVIGIIASGRFGRNYRDFATKITNKNISSILNEYVSTEILNIEEISRNNLDTKIKNSIIYTEFKFEDIDQSILNYSPISTKVIYTKYNPISEFPSSIRDLSYSIKDYSKSVILEKTIMNISHDLIKDVYLFDYYKNDKKKEIKMAFRFTFQSNVKTITDTEVNQVLSDIIKNTISIDSVRIPGLKDDY